MRAARLFIIAWISGSRWPPSYVTRNAGSPLHWLQGVVMSNFFLAVGGFVLLMVALGLARILVGPTDADRLMAAQLLGTGGITALLLLGWATGAAAIIDVALTMALLAAFASFAFVRSTSRPPAAMLEEPGDS